MEFDPFGNFDEKLNRKVKMIEDSKTTKESVLLANTNRK